MSRAECLQVLAGARLARLACAHENQPYVVPVSLDYDEASGCLYGFTTLGQKIEWMRANPLVCVEVDEFTANDQWVSVIVVGRYEELPETPGNDMAHIRALERPRHAGETMPARSPDRPHRRDDDERERAWQVLNNHPEWWEPGCTAWAARVHNDPAEPYKPVYYKVRIDQVTGHAAIRAPQVPIPNAPAVPPSRQLNWLRKALLSVFGGKSKITDSAF